VIIPIDEDGRILVDVDGDYTGSDDAEFITGGSSEDSIDAGAGSDTLDGGAGDDVLVGGHVDEGGTVTVDTDTGAVTFTDTDGIVNENDPAGDDTMIGGAGADTIVGGDGDDVAFGGTGDDVIHGRAGDDVIFGGSGADVINGGAGYDTVDAGTGDDTVFLTNSDATIDGVAGTDTLVVAGAAADADLIINLENASVTSADGSVTVQYLAGFENIVSGDGDDVIIGSEVYNVITGGLGDDTIIGGSGDDTAVFRSSFSIDGTSETTVTFDPEAGTITVEGPDGTDTVSGVENLAFDGLNVSVIDAPTLEDTAFDLDASGSFEDLLSNGAVSITISGVPDGAELLDSAGNPVDAVIEGNTWTLRAETETTVDPETGEETVTVITPLEDVLAGLTIRPDEHSDDDFTLWIGGQNANGGSVGEASMVNMVVTGVADMPNLEVGDVYGVEDELIALDISAGLVDTDTSETLSINISGIPQGTGFNTDGTYSELRAELPNGDPITFALDPNSDNYTIEGYTPTEMESILQSLEIKPPFNHDEDFDLTFAVTATEADGDSATATSIFTVNVMPLADQPNLALRVQEQQDGTPILADGQIIQVDNQEDVAIPLNILPESMDPSEILSLSVSGIPDGAVFEYGIDVAGQTIYVQLPVIDGTVSVPIPNPEVPGGPIPEIATRVTPPHNSNVDFQLTVTATSTEPEAEYRLEPMGAFEDFGNTVESVTISGFPPGTEFSEGTDNGDGTWTLQGYTETVVDPVSGEEITITKTLAEVLEDVTVTPPLEATGDMSLQIAALDDTGASIADNDITFPVEVDGVSVSSLSGVLNIELTGDADPVDIEINDVTGDEDTAIPLDITANLTDTDGSETLSITITGVPAGATLSVGTVSDVDEVTGLQTWTIDPIYETNSDGEQVLVTSVAELLETLTITPPEHSDEEIDLQVTVTNFEHEEDGTVSDQETSGPFDLKVNVNAVADLPNVGVQDASGKEDQAIDLSISPAELVDTDGSETLSITISGVPDGAELTSQSPTGEPITVDVVDGSVTLTEQMIADGILDNLQVTPPGDSNVNFELTVTATATDVEPDIENDPHTDTAISETFIQVEVANDPDLFVHDAEGFEDTPLPLNMNAFLDDSDAIGDGETLSITISNIPDGATLTTTDAEGAIVPLDIGDDGSITLTDDQLPGLHIQAPPDSNEDFVLSVTATSTTDFGDIAETTLDLPVQITGIADDPDLDLGTGEVVGEPETAIPLTINTNLNDLDGSETLTVSISNLPTDAVLSVDGVPLEPVDGVYTLGPDNLADQLAGLTVTPPPGSEESFTLLVTATASDFEPGAEGGALSDTATVGGVLNVVLDEGADPPIVNLGDAQGYEDTAIALNIDAQLQDLEETLTITISDVPSGATLSAGNLNPDGSYTLTQEQLANLTITPPADSNVDFDLTVAVTSIDGDSEATVTETLHVDVIGVADAPNLATEDATGQEDTFIPLDVSSSLNDTDDSETLTITIGNVPEGAVLSILGGGPLTPDPVDGTYTLTTDQLDGLGITPPPGSDADFTLDVTATTVEDDGDTATVNGLINVDVQGVADVPDLNIGDAQGLEDTAIPLNIDAQLADADEVLSVTITRIPTDAVLMSGSTVIPVNNGMATLTQEQLADLTITPPPDSNVDMDLKVTATATQGDSTAQTTEHDLHVDVIGVADAPNLATEDSTGDENQGIPLDISTNLTDTDGSESLSITIGNVPTGATLNHGTLNADGTYTLAPWQLTGLEVNPPADFEGTFTLFVTSTSTENDGDQANTFDVLNVNVEGGADTPTLIVGDSSGLEDSAIALNIDAQLTDLSETLSVTISGVPDGAALSNGTIIDTDPVTGETTWNVMPAHLNTLSITPPEDSNVGFNLTVTAASTNRNGDIAETEGTVYVAVQSVADEPELETENATGTGGEAIDLEIASALTDLDGSESLSLTISGVPQGASLSAGVYTGNGTWALEPGDLNGLIITTPENYDTDFDLTVTATATDSEPVGEVPYTDTASVTATIHVDMEDAQADPPVLVVDDAEDLEDNAIPLDITASLTDPEETLSMTISGVPQGASLSLGTDQGDGVWSFTEADLANIENLTITPPLHSDVDFDLTVTATSQDGDDTATVSDTLTVVVGAVADTPTVSADDGSGDVGQTIPLDISSALVDQDGSESLSITISDVPAGASLSAGTDNQDGTWTLELADLTGLNINLPADASDDFDLTVTATATEADGGDQASNVVTSVINVDPNANDDVNEADLGGFTSGNVITGLGDIVDPNAVADTGSTTGNTITEVTFGDTTVSFSDPGAVQTDENGNFVTIEGDFGTLKMYEDGDYGYVAEEGQAGETGSAGLTDPASPDEVEAAWSGIETFAFDFGTSYLDTNGQLDPSLADDSVSFNQNGIGVEGTQGGMPVPGQINHDENTGQSEALGVNLGVMAATATVQVSNMYQSEDGGEQGVWQAFNADGNLVGEGVLDDTTVDFGSSSNVGTAEISLPDGAQFQYLVFTATDTGGDTNPNDSSDFFIRSIEFETPGVMEGEDLFGYTMADADGDTASATLTINVENNDVTAEPPVLVVDDVTGSEDTAIALNIDASLTDTDGSETLSVTISGVPGEAVLSAGTKNDDGTWTLEPGDLTGLTVTPPANSNEDFTLTVAATSTESASDGTWTVTAEELPLVCILPPEDFSGDINMTLNVTTTEDDGDSTTASEPFTVNVVPVADAPDLDVEPAQGLEDTAIALDVSAVLTDNDDSETLSVTISGIPQGATLSAGVINDDGSVTLTPAQLAGLTITPPEHSNVDFPLTVTATSTETATGETATTEKTLHVDVIGVADEPPLTAELGEGSYEPGDPQVTTVEVTNVGNASAGYNNTYGYYIKGENGEPVEGGIVWSNVKTTVGDTETITLEGVDPSSVGFFLIPDGFDHNPGMTDGMPVTFQQDDAGIWTPVAPDGTPMAGQGAPAFFSDEALNPDDYDHMVDNEVIGNQNWEDLFGGGDNDYNDANFNATMETSGGTPGTTTFPLDIATSLVDADGSETLSVTVSGLPEGVTLSAGTDNGNGTYTLTTAQLDDLSMSVPDGTTEGFDFAVTSTTTEDDGDTASVSTTLTVGDLDVTAEAPELVVDDVSGDEDTAIALDISAALTDTDGSETLSVTISDVPNGVTLSAGTLNDDGSYTLTPDQLDGLTATPPADSNVDFDLTISATSVEQSSGDTNTVTQTMTVDVIGVADEPQVVVQDEQGNEDTWIQLHLDSGPSVDTDGSETLSITISDVPQGARLNPGADNGDGTWTVTAAQLPLVCILPPDDFSGDITMTLNVTTTENDGDTTTVSDDFTVSVIGVADGPSVTATQAQGYEDSAIALNIGASLTDDDNSETLSVTISGIPQGAILSAGTVNNDGSVTLTPQQLDGLTITPPEHSNEDFPLTVSATSTETATGDTATTTATFNVGVTGVADTPSLSVTVDQPTLESGGAGSEFIVNGSFESVANQLDSDDADNFATLEGWQTTDESFEIHGVDYDYRDASSQSDGDFKLELDGGKDDYGNDTGLGSNSNIFQDVQGLAEGATYKLSFDSDNREGDADGYFEVFWGGEKIATITDNTAGFISHGFELVGGAGDGSDRLEFNLIGENEWAVYLDNVSLEGTENTLTYPLDIASGLVDTDGSETLSVTVSGLPDGAALSAGTVNDDGSVTLTAAELHDLSVRVPESQADGFNLSVSSTATENDGDTATVTQTVTIDAYDSGAEAPELEVENATGLEDTVFALNIDAALADADGSETLSVTIGGVPDGASLSAGTDNQDGTWTLTSEQLEGLTLTPPADSNEDFSLMVTATSSQGTDTASTVAELMVDITGVADAPTLSAEAIYSQTTGGETTIDVPQTVLDAATGDNVVTVSGVPDGASLSAGTDNQDGTWTVSAGDVDGLTITPADGSTDTVSLTFDVTGGGSSGDVLFSDNFDNGVSGWGDDAGEWYGAMEIERDETATRTFDFGPEHAGQTVTLSFDSQTWGSWDTSGGSRDYFIVTTNGSEVINTSDRGSDSHSVTVTLDQNGQLQLDMTADATGSDEGVDIDNFVITAGEDYSSTLATASVDVDPDATGHVYDLDITSALTDTDGSETLSITVGNLPNGASLSAGTQNQDGTWTLGAGDLDGLTVTVADNTADFNLAVSATATENDGDTNTVSTAVAITAPDLGAEAPELTVYDAAGDEDTVFALNIDAALTDTDGSETLSVTISGVPDGASLSAGTDNQDGTWTLTQDQLTDLTLTPPADSNEDFSLMVTATSSQGTDTASTVAELMVDITGVADTPTLSIAVGDPTVLAGNPQPIAYWTMDETSDQGTIADSVGGHTGETHCGLDMDDGGVFNTTSAEFKGSNDYISVPHSDDLKPDSGAITLWFNADTVSGRQALVSSDSSGYDTGGHFGLFVENGCMRLRMQGTDSQIDMTDGSVSSHSWNQVTVTWGEAGAQVYMNGEHVMSDANWTRGLEGNDNPWTFGTNQCVSGNDVANNLRDYFNGHMDDIAMFDQQLTADEISDLYSAGVNQFMNSGDGGDLVYPVDITGALTDTDGSETLSISVDGLPDGATLSAGTVNDDGSWSLGADDLDGLTMTVESEVADPFNMTVTTTATEDDGDVATNSAVVAIDPGADAGVTMTGDAADDNLTGTGGDDTVSGGDGDDELFGDDGMDVLYGGAGADQLQGGAGDDVLLGGEGGDTFIFDAESGDDVITDIFANDTLVFEGQEFHMDDLILSENEDGDVVMSFNNVEGASVTLSGVKMEDLDANNDGNTSDGYSVTEDDGKVTITLDNIS